jgi:hypothetical protein
MRKLAFTLSLLAAAPVLAHQGADQNQIAQPALASGAIRHAPLGVMGDHVHNTGEWMFSYRYMRMEMDGNLDGSDSISAAEITGTMMNPGPYMVAPLKMTMEMHMLGAMYAPSDTLTIMAMLPLLNKSMDLRSRMGAKFTTETDGVGDASLAALLRVYQTADKSAGVHLNLGVSLPTGSIDERDDTPAMANAKLPYGMQLGSGTYDLKPGVTYQAYSAQYNWGAQALATLRSGENDNDYRLGNRYEVSGWLARSWSPALSSGVRLKHSSWADIHGADPDLNPMMVPTADTSAQGGERSELLFSANYLFSAGALKGHRLALEYGVPIYQKLDGPQMEMQNTMSLGWQYAP